jgi:hypothetical protein
MLRVLLVLTHLIVQTEGFIINYSSHLIYQETEAWKRKIACQDVQCESGVKPRQSGTGHYDRKSIVRS